MYKDNVSMNFHGRLFESRRHIAHTWPHLTHTAFPHAVLQTFILLSSAKCTTIANLHTLRWSGSDFKRSPHWRPCGRREMPHKTTASATCQLSLPVCLWQSCERPPPHVVKSIARFHPPARLYATPKAIFKLSDDALVRWSAALIWSVYSARKRRRETRRWLIRF